MPRQKRKGATAKIAESGFNKDQDRLSSIGEDLSHKDSIVIEQMQLVKKGKNDHTHKQKKNTSHTACCNNSKPVCSKTDDNKSNISNEIFSKNKYKNKKMVEGNHKRHVMM